jgi:hypothetical protein
VSINYQRNEGASNKVKQVEELKPAAVPIRKRSATKHTNHYCPASVVVMEVAHGDWHILQAQRPKYISLTLAFNRGSYYFSDAAVLIAVTVGFCMHTAHAVPAAPVVGKWEHVHITQLESSGSRIVLGSELRHLWGENRGVGGRACHVCAAYVCVRLTEGDRGESGRILG